MHYGIFVCENSKSGLGIKSDLLCKPFPTKLEVVFTQNIPAREKNSF